VKYIVHSLLEIHAVSSGERVLKISLHLTKLESTEKGVVTFMANSVGHHGHGVSSLVACLLAHSVDHHPQSSYLRHDVKQPSYKQADYASNADQHAPVIRLEK